MIISPSIEIVAIGNEILSGSITNTNATFISQQLKEAGFTVQRHMVLPDDKTTLLQELQTALTRSSIVITTGGLGPTCDDLTREVAAALFQSDFYLDAELAKELFCRYGESKASILDQATLPSKAKIFNNPFGTASGLVFQDLSKTLILLPGVPLEMKEMVVNHLIPFLKTLPHPLSTSYFQKVSLAGIPESAVDPFLRSLQKEYKQVEFGIYPGQGTLSISFSLLSDQEKIARTILKEIETKITQEFKEELFISPTGRLEEAIHNYCLTQKVTLSLAESCTGGHLAAKLTKIPGASKYFLGSIVAYANEVKTNLLNVPKQLIEEKGAVSQEVVKAMALGALNAMKSDYALAISGIAGPSAETDKPIGLLWCALAEKNQAPQVWSKQAHGSREMIIEQGANTLLMALYKKLHSISKTNP